MCLYRTLESQARLRVPASAAASWLVTWASAPPGSFLIHRGVLGGFKCGECAEGLAPRKRPQVLDTVVHGVGTGLSTSPTLHPRDQATLPLSHHQP